MSKFLVQMGWDQAPHLTETAKKELLESTPRHLRDARSKGVPMLGAGAIYPQDDASYVVEPFEIPKYWPKGYGMDVGWNKTAVVWFAHDRESDILYLYSEHYQGEMQPSAHAEAIRGRGEWMFGVIDPASKGRGQSDGSQLLVRYQQLGLNLSTADNGVESGIFAVDQRLSNGKLKIFRTCRNVLSEMSMYRRDKNGKVVKEHDHAVDACFAAGTIVHTPSGPTSIEELPERGEVIGRNGSVSSYHAARLVSRKAKTVILSFNDGSKLRCTPDHLFLTPSGWVQAIDLDNQQVYNAVSQSIQRRQWQTQLFSDLKRSFTWASSITSAANTFSAMVSGFMSRSGRMLMALRQRASTFITKMRIEATTHFLISTFYTVRHTSPITLGVNTGRYQKPLWTLLRYGINQMMVENGTRHITPPLQSDYTRKSKGHVTSAGLSMRVVVPGGFVQMPVNLRFVGRLALIMKNVFASAVARASLLAATARSRTAQGYVGTWCVGVVSAPRADVYCLSVPGTESFAVGSGVLAHNCRYFIASGIPLMTLQDNYLKRMTGKPKVQDDYDPFAAEFAGMGS